MEDKLITKDALGREVKDLSIIRWWGIDRKEIDWFPQINYDKCARCGVCFISCGRRVFDWDKKEDRPIVARPYNCMVACQTCLNLCPCGAIEFPNIEIVKKMSVKAKIVKKAFEIMKDIRDKEETLNSKETEIDPDA